MNVFPSRLFQTENSASNVIRKQDVSNAAIVRKPFADRTVNRDSPHLTARKKPICEDDDAAETLSQYSLDLENDDFSHDTKFKDDDYYEDILPLSKRLEDVHVHQICAKFIDGDKADIDFVVPYGPYENQHAYPLGKIAADILWTAKKLAKKQTNSGGGSRLQSRLPKSYHSLRKRKSKENTSETTTVTVEGTILTGEEPVETIPTDH